MKTNWQRVIECGVGIAAVTTGCALYSAALACIVFGSLLLVPMFADVARSLRRGPQ